jgi:signal peptidase I
MSVEVTDSEAAVVEPFVAVAPAIPPARSILKQVFQGIAVAILAVACYFGISHYLLQSVQVVGVSMYPTLQDSQHYLLNRWIYYVRSPRLQDIVVLKDPSDNGYSVKRVVARPGDSVYLKDGRVFLNGKRLEETYLPEKTPTYPNGRVKDQLVVCGRETYFLLGDNRMNSADSRVYGPVPRRNILGLIVR